MFPYKECPGDGVDNVGRCLSGCKHCEEHLVITPRSVVHCVNCDSCEECFGLWDRIKGWIGI